MAQFKFWHQTPDCALWHNFNFDNSQLCTTAPIKFYPDVTKEMTCHLTEARLLHHKEEPVDEVRGNNRN